jgi:hypothetical protein
MNTTYPMEKENSEEFYEKYKPVYNHLEEPTYKEGQTNGECIGYDQYFETYGRDLEYVKKHDDNLIWTMVDCDGTSCIIQGYRFVNRMNYLIASVPYEEGDLREYIDCIDDYDEG